MPHQQQAAEVMVTRTEYLLADEPGLGKTPPVIVAISMVYIPGTFILVVCPRNVIRHWKNLFAIWAPTIPAAFLMFTNYEQLKNLTAAGLLNVNVLVLDEIHKLKNEESLRFRSLYTLWEAMNYDNAFKGRKLRIYGLSGTPIYSYPIDLCMILILLRQMDRGHIPLFKARYCDPKRRKLPGKKIKVLDLRGSSNLDELKRLCQHFVMRRTFKDAGVKMPALTLTDLYVKEKITDPEYYAATENFREFYTERGGKISGADMARFTVLRRILAVAKSPAVIEQILDDLKSGMKTVVFTEFRDSASMIHEGVLAECEEGDPRSFLVMGGQTEKARGEILDAFIAANGAAALVATTDCLGEGYDGLQKVCRLVNFVDIDFEPAMFVQALRRIWRFGQENPVTVRRFVVEGDKMENFILENVRKKDGVQRQLGWEDSASLTNLMA